MTTSDFVTIAIGIGALVLLVWIPAHRIRAAHERRVLRAETRWTARQIRTIQEDAQAEILWLLIQSRKRNRRRRS